MQIIFRAISPLLAIVLCTSYSQAASRTEAAATLLEAPGARTAALGEAFTAVNNDITAFGYNPASLNTLENGQSSFLYQRGAIEDTYGQIMVGLPVRNRTFGLSIGFYDAGGVDVFDGENFRTVNAQRDLIANLGYATHWRGISVGVTGKYFSSELGEAASAKAFAADIGTTIPLFRHFRVGASLQNFGTKLKFVSERENLPEIARLGMAYQVFFGESSTQFFFDTPYFLNQNELRPAVGVETLFGPLAIRLGYKSGSDLEEFSVGAGFFLGASSLDYSFGLVDELDSRHRVSLGLTFGGYREPNEFVWFDSDRVRIVRQENIPSAPKTVSQEKPKTKEKPKPVVKTPEPKEIPKTTAKTAEPKEMPLSKSAHIKERRMDDEVVQYDTGPKPNAKYTIYTVQEGETFESIAKLKYGYKEYWDQLYFANKHLLTDPNELKAGMRIILPQKVKYSSW